MWAKDTSLEILINYYIINGLVPYSLADQLLLAVKRNGDDGKDSPGNTVDKRKAALEEEYLLRGPSVKDIQRATEHLPATEQTPPKVNIDDMVLQTDVRGRHL